MYTHKKPWGKHMSLMMSLWYNMIIWVAECLGATQFINTAPVIIHTQHSYDFPSLCASRNTLLWRMDFLFITADDLFVEETVSLAASEMILTYFF